jgi:hypothetical protein
LFVLFATLCITSLASIDSVNLPPPITIIMRSFLIIVAIACLMSVVSVCFIVMISTITITITITTNHQLLTITAMMVLCEIGTPTRNHRP